MAEFALVLGVFSVVLGGVALHIAAPGANAAKTRLSLLERVWYWKIRDTPPLATSYSRHLPSRYWARLVPYRWRRFHERYARRHGFYWLPCPLCDEPHGGHEGGKSIPDPGQGPQFGIIICSRCSLRLNVQELV
ncbi:hypothetical protein ACFWYW_46805 [Nonomuraea sp. NPDC059023]|uniref:hypothetical protein n=1 Tax=unclassified Nonomuraea TaxID=2593643 RepID=UPI0036AB7209